MDEYPLMREKQYPLSFLAKEMGLNPVVAFTILKRHRQTKITIEAQKLQGKLRFLHNFIMVVA